MHFLGDGPSNVTEVPVHYSSNVTNERISNPEAHNDSSLESLQTRTDAELAALISTDTVAVLNRGVFLPLSDEKRSRIWQENEHRRQRVADVCAQRGLSQNLTRENLQVVHRYTNVAVDDKHKLLYCYIPKVGCTSWKVKLCLMGHQAKEAPLLNTHPSPVDSRPGLAQYGIKMLSSFSTNEIKRRIQNYYKFVFVRHPMERIVSSYRSKFEKRIDNKVEYPYFYNTFGECS